MALFGKPKTQAMIETGAPATPVAAASGYASGGANNIGASMVGNFYAYQEGTLRNNAMSVPTIARARDLIASVVGGTRLEMYKETWDPTEKDLVTEEIAPRAWLRQPDPTLPYSTFMSWLLDDLFFFGRAFLFINSRTADGFPNSFQRLPAAMCNTRDQAGPVWFGPSDQVYFQGGHIESSNLVQLISPIQGIVYQSEKMVQTALRLEAARYRNASSTIPAGTLKITGGEPLTPQEMADLAATFNSARENNQTAALSQDVDYIETKANPANMMLMEAANYQALEACRVTNIPPYLAGIDIGSYQYSSGKDSREQLYLFAARLYMDCIAQTLSMNNVLPVGTYCRFDIDDYLSEIVETEEEHDPQDVPSTMNTVIEDTQNA